MKRFILLAFAALLPLFVSAKDDAPREGLTVMSFNIRNSDAKDGTNSWMYRYPAVALMLDEQKPDVIGMQEVLPEQFEYLKNIFDKTFKIVGVGRDDGKKAGEMMAIMYNPKTVSLVKWGTFWLSETPDTPSKGWDAACFRTATWAVIKDKATGKKAFFVNTHLDHKGVEAQKNGAALIVSKIAELNTDSLPVIVTGDFNMEWSDAGLSPLKGAFGEARQTAVKSDDVPSFNGWGKEKKTLDHIWYKGLSCIKFETVTKPYYERKFVSDHYPVKATMVF